MTHLEELNLLIDKASAIAGSDAKLARLVGAHPQNVSNWRHGKSCPPEMQALMADVAGLDPIAELARATVRRFEGDKKGDLLMKALGKASRLTGAVAGFVGAVALAIFSMTPQPGQAQTVSALHNECYVK
uniref:helix-turn-helix domain-containing protein n=1 Tax=unclassified Variovorax TaxID=663243 RepID=UPI001404713A